jgi:hypothetical protein
METPPMTKKKPEAKPPTAPGPRRTVLTIKGTDEWRGWLERLGEHLRTPASTIVDHALVRYAREMGFKEEAPKR